MTHIKITGLVRPEDADAAARLGVDLVACVLSPASPRYVTTEQVWEIRRALHGRAQLVGVFVDSPTPLVQRLMDHCQFDCAQLFGSEPRSAVEAVRPHAFKAVSVASAADADLAGRVHGRRSGPAALPGLLLHVVEGASPGLVAGAARRHSLLLAAAGLTADNVAEVIRDTRPWGVDVWDAVERSPGQLDLARLEAFVTAVRAADAVPG